MAEYLYLINRYNFFRNNPTNFNIFLEIPKLLKFDLFINIFKNKILYILKMENSINRHYFKLSLEEEKEYLKNQKKFIRFTLRCNDEDISLLSTKFKDIKSCKKADNSFQRDKVVEYQFNNIIDYDNSKAREMIINHIVIITKEEYVDEIKSILNELSDNVIYRNNGRAITTHFNQEPLIRGLWVDADNERNIIIQYPICVLSYKRANEYGKTHLTLTRMKIKHYLFIEPSQKEEYEKWYNKEYCELITTKNDLSKTGMGSSPVRNYILDWASYKGYSRVWMLDDNIKGYLRYYQGVKNPIESKTIFASIEKYINRYKNVGAVSHNFNPFVCENDARCVIVKNGKCYSSMLLDTNCGIRFRYKHQEDNLISMEYINKGYCNLCFNHILYNKDTSGTNKGGNRESIYKCKDNNTDGDGYQERYFYYYCILNVLHIEGKIKLIEGKTINDLVKRSTTMKSKKYHASTNYKVLDGYDKNDIIKYEGHNDNEPKYALKLIVK
jgi:hypothetical protein